MKKSPQINKIANKREENAPSEKSPRILKKPNKQESRNPYDHQPNSFKGWDHGGLND